MRTVTENALTVTQGIIEEQRKELEAAKEWEKINPTQRSTDSRREAANILGAMERIMFNLGLEC